MVNSLFVNLPIANLKKSVEFFTELGFTFNPQFTDEQSTCMIINENIFVMLLEHAKFESFIQKKITSKDTAEAILALSCDSVEEVKTLTQKALDMGARRVSEPEDMGFMFGWGFEDLDGHLWDVFWMNPDHVM